MKTAHKISALLLIPVMFLSITFSGVHVHLCQTSGDASVRLFVVEKEACCHEHDCCKGSTCRNGHFHDQGMEDGCCVDIKTNFKTDKLFKYSEKTSESLFFVSEMILLPDFNAFNPERSDRLSESYVFRHPTHLSAVQSVLLL